MNIYVIFIIVGIVLQILGGYGYLNQTAIEKTTTQTIEEFSVIDNETGTVLSTNYNHYDIKKWKLISRDKND